MASQSTVPMVPGTILNVRVHNFMQYSDVSFKPGRNLNVIVGPNGAGKSTIVNAICLGLAGKTESLGRGKTAKEFLQTGKEEAEIEVMLHRSDHGTVRAWSVTRRWTKDNKTKWKIDGENKTEKDVRAFVTRLNIQTDNLCQFLPQDKVHEFSKMAPKALMHKTIDAVGEEELKDDHKRLMEMQTELDEGEASFAAKEQRLRDCEQKKEGLEQEVKNFRERKELEGSIELHGKRKEWAIYDERRRACKELRAVYKEATDKLRKEEERLEPLKRKMTECKAGRARTDQSIKSKITSGSQCLAEAKTASQRVEAIEEDLDGIDADQERNEAREEQRKEEQRNLEESVAALRQQLEEEEVRAASSADNGGAGAIKVQEEIANKMRELHTIEENKVGIDQSLGQNRYEATAANNSVRQSEQRIAQLQNVRSQMVDKIAKMPGGRDIVKAMDWLSNNREKFKGRVYDPVLTQISVTDPRYSVYLEQLVAFKDLVAFGADEISDVNLLMNQMRRMGTKVNVFHARRAGNELNPTVPGESFDRKCEFKGYAADLFTAPAAIKEHLCRMYKLHNTPVFGKGAEKIVESLIEKYQFRVFFIDRERYNCVKSKYMNGVTTSIDKLREPRNYFTAAVDKNRLRQLQAEIAKSKKQKDELAEQEEQMKAALTDASREADELKKEVKNLKQRQERVSIVKTRIKSKETKLKEFLAAAGNRDLKRAKRELAVRRARLEAETLEMADKLKRVVVDGNNIKIKLEVEKVKHGLLMAVEELLRGGIVELEDGLQTFKREAEAEKAALTASETDLEAQRVNVKRAMGGGQVGERPPKALADEFKAKALPETVDAIEMAIAELIHQATCIDKVDPEVVLSYQKLEEEIDTLQRQVQEFERNAEKRRGNITELRDRWLESLESLVGRIAVRFSHYFESMGFAGDVALGRGTHLNDFANYGIDILVKFRTNEPLQRLTPHQQSGGERSVATALYMLALQELTVVPFRCVDEINQGMDSVNERRVFDLLVQTSCRERSAQYFLLTPKLLPDLKYDRNMTVLVVNNGEGMCGNGEWDMAKFVERARSG